MEITINQFVIHNVRKNQEEPEKAEELLDLTDEDIEALGLEIASLFWKKANISYGRFKNSNELFPRRLKEDVIIEAPELGFDDKNFLELSQEATDKIHDEMKSTSGTGGYVAHLGYSKGSSTYYMAALIKNTSAFEIVNLKPEKGFKVDTSKLHQAVNVNIRGMLANLTLSTNEISKARNFIGLLSKSSEPTDYFRDAFASKSHVDNSTASANAPKVVRRMLISEGFSNEVATQAFNIVADYLIENEGKDVTLDKMNNIANSFLVPEHPDKLDYLLEFVKTIDEEIPSSFRSKPASIKKLRKVSYSTSRWSIDIHKDLIGRDGEKSDNKFRYNSDNRSLTIEGLPDELIEQLEQVFDPTELDENE
ncbi:MAG: nucleoid-associated protein [Alteromonadaceae bacterium]|nr:nucleoid-associated protein [Alteromonadaceae bacterium]